MEKYISVSISVHLIPGQRKWWNTCRVDMSWIMIQQDKAELSNKKKQTMDIVSNMDGDQVHYAKLNMQGSLPTSS